MALTSELGKEYKIYYPDKNADEQDVYVCVVVGQHTDTNNPDKEYNLVSVQAVGKCEQIFASEESERLDSI